MLIKIDNVNCTFHKEDCDQDAHFRQLGKHLCVYAPGFQYTGAFRTHKATKGAHGWDGKVKLFTGGKLLTGLLPKTIEFYRKKKIFISRPKLNITDERIILPEFYRFKSTIDLRGYQEEAIDAAFRNTMEGMWWPRGIIQIATGGGKTLVAAAMIQMTKAAVDTLFVVHRKDLLHQTYKVFKECGINVGRVGDGIKETDCEVIVGTIQTLSKLPPQYFYRFDQVFFDEAHHLASTVKKGNIFCDFSKLLPNAYMRWGLTATPFMKDNFSDLLLEGTTGKVLFEEKSASLIEKGYLAKPTIQMLPVPKDDKLTNAWPGCYDTGIVYNKGRNSTITVGAMKADKPCLVLVTRIDHGENLARELRLKGQTAKFISGKDDSSIRKKAVDHLRNGTLPILITTTIFDEGIDIPEVSTVIMAGGGRSQVKTLQRLGRGLRLAEGKDQVKIIDFMDYTTKTLFKHSRARKMIWENEGYEVEEI